MNDDILHLEVPQHVLPKLFKRVPRYIVITFISAFTLCLLVHHQAYSTALVNLDNIGYMFGSNYGAMSGRWLLPAVLSLEGDLSMPWLIGMIAALFVSMSVCIVVSLTRVRTAVGCIAVAAIMVTFPTIASNNFYMFSADAYMLSLFLSCLGAYFTVKYRFGFIPGGILLVLSADIYQAFMSAFVVLLVGTLIFELLDGEKSVWQTIKKGIKYLLTVAVAIAAYYVIVQLTTQTTGLTDYKGINDMGTSTLKELRWTVVAACTNYMGFYVFDGMQIHSGFAVFAFVLMMAATAVMGLYVLIRRKLDWKKIVLLGALIPCYLIGGNLTRLLAPLTTMHMLMIYGVSFLPVGAVALGEYIYSMNETKQERSSVLGRMRTVCVWVVVCAAFILSANYAIRDNEAYFKADIIEKESVSFANRMLTVVQHTEGYEAGMPLVLVGSMEAEQFENKALENVYMTGCMEFDSVIRCYTYDRFLKYYCGWLDDIYIQGDIDDPAVNDYYASKAEVREMPVYPSQGSVKVIDGYAVVKLADPKADHQG